MLTLTKKTDYALVALSHLAQRKRDNTGPISARLIAETYQLPLPLLMNILKELAQAKLVSSTRGATGGYELAVEPDRVSLLEVINAIEGPVKLTACCDELPIVGQGCNLESRCPIQNAVRKLHRRMLGFFEQVNLAELTDESDDPTPAFHKVSTEGHAPQTTPRGVPQDSSAETPTSPQTATKVKM